MVAREEPGAKMNVEGIEKVRDFLHFINAKISDVFQVVQNWRRRKLIAPELEAKVESYLAGLTIPDGEIESPTQQLSKAEIMRLIEEDRERASLRKFI